MAKGLGHLLSGKGRSSIHWVRVVILICVVIALYLLGRLIADMLVEQFSLHLRGHNEPMLHRAIMTATVVFIVLMAIPFAPAAEIGLSMLLIFGGQIAFLVYVSTVVALTLAYLIGRFLPAGFAAKAFNLLGLAQAEQFVKRLAPLSANERLELLARDSPARLVPIVTRHRFLTLAVLLNLPGNIVIGGGGGIALLAGMTRLFPLPAYILTVAFAVAPIPVIIYWTG